MKGENRKHISSNRFPFFISFLIITGICLVYFLGAIPGTADKKIRGAQEDFDLDYIISDEVFTNVNSMTVEQIQAFLESKKSPLADKNLYQRYFLTYPIDMEIYNLVFPNGKLARESSPAEIIYYLSHGQINPGLCGNQINPKIIIVMLETTLGLIESARNLNQNSLDNAFKINLLENGNYLFNYQGFVNQLKEMISKLRCYFEYFANNQKKKDIKTVIDGIGYHPRNSATFALQKYLLIHKKLYEFNRFYKIYFENLQIADSFQFPLAINWNITCNYFWSCCWKCYHLGEDVLAPAGTRVYSPGNGAIKHIGPRTKYGNVIIIEHYTGSEYVCTVMGHLRDSDIQIYVGQEVGKGQWLGSLGNKDENGDWDEHIHFGIRKGQYLGDYATVCGGEWAYAGYTDCASGKCDCNILKGEWYVPSDFIRSHQSSLVSADGQTVYYLQNNRIYHVIDPTIAIMMTNAGMPGWTWPNFVTVPSLTPYIEGPEFIAGDSRSDGLLIRQKNADPVYTLQNGKKRWIKSQEALNWKGNNWTNDVIVVPPEIILGYVPNNGNNIYAIGEGESNSSIKNNFISAYDANENTPNSYCKNDSSWKGWPGSFSKCLEFPINQVGDAYISGYSGISGRYQKFGAEYGEKGTINYSSKGTYSVHGAIYTKFQELGYSGSALGFPISDEYEWNGKRRSNFEGGYIYWDPATNQTFVIFYSSTTTSSSSSTTTSSSSSTSSSTTSSMKISTSTTSSSSTTSSTSLITTSTTTTVPGPTTSSTTSSGPSSTSTSIITSSSTTTSIIIPPTSTTTSSTSTSSSISSSTTTSSTTTTSIGVEGRDITWVYKSTMPEGKVDAACAVVGGKIYVIGGTYNKNTNYEYDPSSNTWTRKADLPGNGQVYEGGAAVVNNKVYVISPPSSYIIMVYNPSTDSWNTGAEMPTHRNGAVLEAVDGKIYAIGGAGDSNVVEEYDPSTNTWARKADMPTGRGYAAANVIDGKIYVYGGGNGARDMLEIFDPINNSWTTKTFIFDYPTPRKLATAVAVNGRMYVIGGLNGSALNNVETYYPSSNAWKAKNSIITSRYSHVSAIVNNKIYVMGGQNSTGTLNSVEEGSFSGLSDQYSVSGHVTLSGQGFMGVTIFGLPGNPISNTSGYYNTGVDHGWIGDGTPSKSGYSFSPTSSSYFYVTQDQSNQDYLANLLTTSVPSTSTSTSTSTTTSSVPTSTSTTSSSSSTTMTSTLTTTTTIPISTSSTTISTTTTSTPVCPRLGDVTGDGSITPGDAQLAFEIYLGRVAPNYCQAKTSDANCDTNITPQDAQWIFEHYLV